MLCVVCRLMVVRRWLLVVVACGCCLLFAVSRCLLCVACRLLVVRRWSLVVVVCGCCWLFMFVACVLYL